MVIRKLTLLLLLAGSCSSGDNTPSLPTFDPDALISVSGTMIDIRDVRSGDALYPQNDDFKIPQEFAIAFGSNMHYATTLREYRGVERVSADHPTILRIAVADNTHPGSMWNDSRTSFRIGSLRMHLYTCHYTTPGKWIPVPSGQPNAATLVFGRKITVDGVPPAPQMILIIRCLYCLHPKMHPEIKNDSLIIILYIKSYLPFLNKLTIVMICDILF